MKRKMCLGLLVSLVGLSSGVHADWSPRTVHDFTQDLQFILGNERFVAALGQAREGFDSERALLVERLVREMKGDHVEITVCLYSKRAGDAYSPTPRGEIRAKGGPAPGAGGDVYVYDVAFVKAPRPGVFPDGSPCRIQ